MNRDKPSAKDQCDFANSWGNLASGQSQHTALIGAALQTLVFSNINDVSVAILVYLL